MRNVMKKAWEIAKDGVRKFGGCVKEYFAEALRMAWAIAKKIMETMNKMQIHTWKNAKGMEFELHAEHITKESRTTDWGETLETEVNWVHIDKFLVDGKSYQQGTYISRKVVNGVVALDLGNVVYQGRKINMVVAMPEAVNQAVWGAFDVKEQAKKDARKRVEKIEKEEMKKKIANGYCPECGSYCWGDCQAN